MLYKIGNMMRGKTSDAGPLLFNKKTSRTQKIVTEPQFLKSHREPKRDKKENCKEKDNRETSKKSKRGR